MWRSVLLLLPVLPVICGRLTGDHVCLVEVRYTVNVTEYFLRNSTIRSYNWCLNVPPRCSYYTTGLVNDSRIVERKITDIAEKCCPGFEENKETSACEPTCTECVNGTCKNGQCFCKPGFKGIFCDIACPSSHWGGDCKYKCMCERGNCDPVTGNCTCPSGWSGNRCEQPCPEGFYGQDCAEICTCNSSKRCDHITGQCQVISISESPPLLTDAVENFSITESDDESVYSTTPLTTIRKEIPTKFTDIRDQDYIKTSTVPFRNNGKFELGKLGLLSTISVLETSQVTDSIVDTTEERIDKEYSRTNQINDLLGKIQEENYINDEENVKNPSLNKKNDLVNGVSTASAIIIAIIIVAIAIVAVSRLKRNRKKQEQERSKGIPTVSVYTQSIFHTPLPDPPTFENPVFTTPLVDSSPSETQRIETRVICSMNFPPHPTKESANKEYLYDHPPSTGSYRAASIPEPPELSSFQPLTHSEPVYDEIPSGTIPTPISEPPPSYKSSSLYMNTFGRTRL